MKEKGLLLLALFSLSVHAADFNAVDALSERSKLPASEVSALLADCDANQTSTNFCSWRDQLVAEHDLQILVDEKSAASATCKSSLDAEISAWRKRRDTSCEKTAQKQYAGGSMLPAAKAICATAETRRMIKRVRARKCP
jgi:uncharacterized protein YecT (DUF1311 family)